MTKTLKKIYILLCLLIMLLPFVGMIRFRTDETTENKTLAGFPELKTENGINIYYFSQLGDYFNDHFAFRNYMVDADSRIQSDIFKTSNADTVIAGNNGWLYYTSTLDNYLSRNGLSERGIFNAVHNIKLMQQYVESKGAKFILAIPPNKNSLYGENMPYYYRHSARGTNNLSQITEEFNEQQVDYADLFEAFHSSDEVLYLKRDSHWNNSGAALAYNTIMDKLDMLHERYEAVDIIRTKDYIGDLNRMLYPVSSKPEWNTTYQYERNFSYVGSDDVEYNWLKTENPEKDGSLLMFRDSFGNTLIPFFAEEFGTGYFSKAIPYNIDNYMNEYTPDVVVVEKVERNIEEFASMPAVFENPPAADTLEDKVLNMSYDNLPDGESEEIMVKLAEANISFLAVSGYVDDGLLQKDSLIYVRVQNGEEDLLYEAFTITDEKGDNGYLLYLDRGKIASDEPCRMTVYVGNESEVLPVCSYEIDVTTIYE